MSAEAAAQIRWGPVVAGLVGALAILVIDSPLHHYGEHGDRPAHAAAVTFLMAAWWLTEAVPIQWTALVPILTFPFLTVVPGGFFDRVTSAARPYIDPYIFLFLGGMCIAAAMQQWGLHRRIAVRIMATVGTDPKRLLLGVLAGTAFVSMWISNTATAAMMLPIALSVVLELERQSGGTRLVGYGASTMLAVAYGANIGGIGTKIGTAPNTQFAQFMSGIGVEVGFLQFMAVGLPFVVLFIPFTWWLLWTTGRGDAPSSVAGERVIAEAEKQLGPMSRGEWIVLGVFCTTAGLWMAGSPLTALVAPEFTDFKVTGAMVEGTIAMTAALFLLLCRVQGQAALALRSLRLVPWDTLVLLGGAFSMAAAVQSSGLSRCLGDQLSGLSAQSLPVQVFIASFATVALSAFTSNTATTGVMLNVLRDAVSAHGLTTVLFAATIAASCDFALPAGTPPNAIVFGSGYLTVSRMVRTGLVLDVAAAALAAAWCLVAVPIVFG
ncbi:MAG: SLC13 family permease [Bradymonadia bacterium]